MEELIHRCDPLAAHIVKERHLINTREKSASYISQIFSQIKKLSEFDSRSIIPLILVISSFLVAWRVTSIVTNCDNPLVVVLSGSMEPAFYRGDLLILHKVTPIVVSDVIVFNLPQRSVPIVHRVHRVHEDSGTRLFLTKGDNNEFDDRTLYPEDFYWIQEEHVIGKVFVIIPRAGFLTLLADGKPWVKVGVLCVALVWGWFAGV